MLLTTVHTVLLQTIFSKLHKTNNVTALNKAEMFLPSHSNKQKDDIEIVLYEQE
jgi:outer membrane protein assembly factor BamD (BamD/ComL family)